MSARAAFETDWRGRFGAAVPTGATLRAAHPMRWTRVHALPRSKRYAEDEGERATILARADRLGTRLFGTGSPLWVVLPRWGEEVGASPALPGDPVAVIPPRRQDGEAEAAERAAFHVWPAVWREERFAALFSAVAEDRDRAVFCGRGEDGPHAALAPCDGGFDVICATPGAVARMEAEFAAWMSPRADRL